MMGNIPSVSRWLSQLSHAGSMNTTTATGKGGGADMPPPPGGGPPPGGPMLDALAQALSPLGFGDNASTSRTGTVTAVDSSSATAASSDATQALSAFMQGLMGALQAQGSNSVGGDRDGNNDGGIAASGPQGTGYRPDLRADLQSLIQTLASGSTGAATSGSAADASLSKLQEDFQTMVSALGGSERNLTLAGFLQNVASNMAGASASGNLISERV